MVPFENFLKYVTRLWLIFCCIEELAIQTFITNLISGSTSYWVLLSEWYSKIVFDCLWQIVATLLVWVAISSVELFAGWNKSEGNSVNDLVERNLSLCVVLLSQCTLRVSCDVVVAAVFFDDYYWYIHSFRRYLGYVNSFSPVVLAIGAVVYGTVNVWRLNVLIPTVFVWVASVQSLGILLHRQKNSDRIYREKNEHLKQKRQPNRHVNGDGSS